MRRRSRSSRRGARPRPWWRCCAKPLASGTASRFAGRSNQPGTSRKRAGEGAVMQQVNIIAVLVAALSSFLLGGLWYSRLLFGQAWHRASGATQDPEQKHRGRVFAVSFLFALVAAFTYALLMPPAPNAVTAVVQGLAVGVGFVAASFGINYQFANRSMVMWLVDGGYHAV